MTLLEIANELNKFPQKKSELFDQIMEQFLKVSLTSVQATVHLAESCNWTDKQEYLDWEDSLNELSVKDHTRQTLN